MTASKERIEALRREAALAGDREQVDICALALADEGEDNIYLATTKGGCLGTLEEACAWQAEHQGGAATINGVDVGDIDFDADDIFPAVNAVCDRARSLCAAVIAAADDRSSNG